MRKQKIVRIAGGEQYEVPDGWRVVQMQAIPGYSNNGAYSYCYVLLEEVPTGEQQGPYRTGG